VVQYSTTLAPKSIRNTNLIRYTKFPFFQEAKLFIGLGFPYEGPAPLEAIANGCFFLNPKLSPPVNRVNTKFFNSKPTLRSLTSQNPYAEEFIAAPYVYTINADDPHEVDKTMKMIKNQSVRCGSAWLGCIR